MDVVAHLLRKAAQCRRLASEFLDPDDPAVTNLRALADEFEARAQMRASERRATAGPSGSENANCSLGARQAPPRAS
jgi:hypothetical protein